MCPISGLVQFLIVLVALLLLCHAVVVRSCQIHFKPTCISKLIMYDTVNVSYYIISDTGPHNSDYSIYSENKDIAGLAKDEILVSSPQNNLAGTLNITGNFLGKTSIKCKNRLTNKVSSEKLDIIVVRRKRVIDVVFTASVAMLVSILYINFGCAIDWSELSNILKRPVGPAIGFFGQFVIMPLRLGEGELQHLLAYSPEMRLGMFFTGVSPAGGASNVWAVVLEGNMSLSIIMTAISTIAAFGMMPLWIFTLGKTIFDSADLRVPYREILTYVIALIVPLGIGYLIQRYLKRVATFMTRIIKGFSSCLILFIIAFAIVTNLYLFQLFSWKIILAGMGLPWLGYLAGYICGYILRQPHPDSLTIAIEVGIQNTGIAIFLLRFALPQPEADLTTGRTKILCQNNGTGATLNSIDVIVIRPERVIDSIFTASVATLISVIYINFGAALDWSKLKEILKRPTGPAIAFCGQFIFQPLVAYGMGKLLFPENPDQQLGLLFTGASPGGGASNLWTLLLGGNVGLSIVATAMSTIAAFAMMPFWLFTLGRSIFESGR
nr:unnamed protein product [Callosobruchus analis]